MEYEWEDKKYCYPNTGTLINKLGIRNNATLNSAERELTALRIYELEENPVKGNFDLKHLQEIHKYIFQDLYDWAGQIRTVNIAKGNVFCNFQFITMAGEDIFKKIAKENYLINIPRSRIGERLAYYFGEINALHPFREGNGRTQREFIKSLGLVAGYDMDFSKFNSVQMIQYSDEAFRGNYTSLTNLFNQIISPISSKEQKQFLELITANNSPIRKVHRKLSINLEKE